MSDNVEDVIAKQQTILDNYFSLLGSFSFDKAKEYLDKEREISLKNRTVAPFFSSALAAFAALAPAEKSYCNFVYLGPKGFLRKDSTLKSSYESLSNEFQRLEKKHYISPVSTPTSSCRTPSPSVEPPSPGSEASSVSSHTFPAYLGEDILENLASHLCGQLLSYVRARLRTMEVYEKLLSMSSNRFMKIDQVLLMISDIVKTNLKLFHHPMISPLKSSFSAECEILMKLLEAEIHMQNWRFLPALLSLHDAHSKLGTWVTLPKDTKKLSVSFRQQTTPPLYNWLRTLKNALVSKFTLYFHEVLSKQTSLADMKNFISKATVDYFNKIMAFQKRNDVACIFIVLDTNGLEGYAGHGYTCPLKHFEAPKGLDSFPPIVSYPQNCFTQERHSCHWPSVIMIMNNKEQEMRNTDSAVFVYDIRMNATYFMAKIEARMTLVFIFESKKTDKDTFIHKFMHGLCTQLRGNKIFASLKPGSK